MTDAQRQRLTRLDQTLRATLKTWCTEHDVSGGECVSMLAATTIGALLSCGKTADDVRSLLEGSLQAMLADAADAVEANTRAPERVQGGN